MNISTNWGLIALVFLSLIGGIMSYPLELGFCTNVYQFGDSQGCLDHFVPTLGHAILIFSASIFPFLLILRFFDRQLFLSWVRFTAVSLPIAILLIVVAPDTDGGSWLPSPSSQEALMILLPALYILASVIIIAYKSWRLRR